MKQNVITMLLGGLSRHDAKVIETIAHVLGGEGLRLQHMQVTRETLQDFVTRCGPPSSKLLGFVFPAYRWYAPAAARTHRLLVVDQGELRVFVGSPCIMEPPA